MCCSLNYVLITGSQRETFTQPSAACQAGLSPIDNSALIGESGLARGCRRALEVLQLPLSFIGCIYCELVPKDANGS